MTRHQEPAERSLPARYLSPADLAALLGIPVQTVYQWRCQRTGPVGFRVGKHVRYDPRTVQEWIDGLVRGVA
jgi:hypothetical protein